METKGTSVVGKVREDCHNSSRFLFGGNDDDIDFNLVELTHKKGQQRLNKISAREEESGKRCVSTSP